MVKRLSDSDYENNSIYDIGSILSRGGLRYTDNGTGRGDLGYTTWNDGTNPWGGAMEFYSSVNATNPGYVNFVIGNTAANARFQIISHTPANAYEVEAWINQDGSATFTGDVSVPDESYGAGWNSSLEVPTKNSVYDKVEALDALTATRDANIKTRSAIVGLTSGDYPVSSYANASAAIAAALAANDHIYIKNGTYALTSDIQITASNKSITGESETGTILRLNTGVNTSVITTGSNTGIISNVQLRNLTIDQQGASQAGGGGIVVVGIQNWTFENITLPVSFRFQILVQSQGAVANKTGTVTFTQGSEMLAGSGTTFTTDLPAGSIIKEPTTGMFARVAKVISNTSVRLTRPWSFATQTGVTYKNIPANSYNKFINVKAYGTLDDRDNIGLGLCDYSVIDRCYSANASGAGCGFVPDHAKGMMISNSVAANNANAGFSYETCEDMLTVNCISYGAGTGNGYQLISGGINCRVENMQCWNNASHGFAVNNSSATYPVPTRNSFLGVSAWENGGYGMRIDGANKTYVKGSFYNNTLGGYIQNTANSVVPADTMLDTVRCYDDRTTKEQVYGIWLVSGTNTTLNLPQSLDADHVTAGINDQATGTTIITALNGNYGINNKAPANRFNVNTPTTASAGRDALYTSGGATNVPFAVQAAPAQTGNLMEFMSSAGNNFMYISSGGLIRTTTSAVATPAFSFASEGGTGMGRTAGVANTLFLSTAANERVRINTEKTEFFHGMAYKRTAVGNTNYTVLATDYLIEYTSLSAPRTVTLPTAVGAAGQVYIIKDGTANAGTSNITIATTSSQTIDGSSTATISVAHGQLAVYSDGANWQILWKTTTKAEVGLSNVDNTSDANKPVSTAQALAIEKTRTTVATVGPTNSDYITDGTADEVQINAAITAVNAAGGGTVQLRAGTYTTAATIVLKSKVKLIGEGIGNTIITGAASDYRLAGTTLSGTTKTVYTNVEVRDITFKSNYGTGLAIFNTDGVIVSGCEFTFTVTTPIKQTLFIEHCRNVIVTENIAHDYTGNGLSVTSTDYFTIANNVISGGANGDDGIDVDFDFLDTSAIPSNYGTITGNTVRTIGRGNGIRVENSNYVSVSGNVVDAVASTASIAAGILINTTTTNVGTGITVTGNTVTNCIPGGISTSGTNLTNVIINGNTIYNCGADSGSVRGGIVLNSAGVSVTSNIIDTTLKSGTDGAAILIYKRDGQIIQNNVIRNSVTGIRTWNGDALQSYTSCVITDNTYSGNTSDAILTAITAGTQESNNFGQTSYANSMNQVAIASALAGTSPTISAVGPDTNLGMTFVSKGSGRLLFRPGSDAINAISFQNAGVTNTILNLDTTNLRVGIQTTTPTSSLYVNGSFGLKRAAIADTNTTLDGTQSLVVYTSLTAGRTITLPSATTNVGRIYMIKDETGSAATYNLTLATTSSQTIDGASTAVINTNYGHIAVYSDGANWKILWRVNTKADVGLGNVDNTSNATERAATATLTNKTIALGSNTVSGTLAQFNTAVTDADLAPVASPTFTGTTTSAAEAITNTNGTLNITSVTDGGDFNIYHTASGTKTLAFYGSAGNSMNVAILDGTLTVQGQNVVTATTGAPKLTVATSAPGSPATGDLWVDTN